MCGSETMATYNVCLRGLGDGIDDAIGKQLQNIFPRVETITSRSSEETHLSILMLQ